MSAAGYFPARGPLGPSGVTFAVPNLGYPNSLGVFVNADLGAPASKGPLKKLSLVFDDVGVGVGPLGSLSKVRIELPSLSTGLLYPVAAGLAEAGRLSGGGHRPYPLSLLSNVDLDSWRTLSGSFFAGLAITFPPTIRYVGGGGEISRRSFRCGGTGGGAGGTITSLSRLSKLSLI